MTNDRPPSVAASADRGRSPTGREPPTILPCILLHSPLDHPNLPLPHRHDGLIHPRRRLRSALPCLLRSALDLPLHLRHLTSRSAMCSTARSRQEALPGDPACLGRQPRTTQARTASPSHLACSACDGALLPEAGIEGGRPSPRVLSPVGQWRGCRDAGDGVGVRC